MLTADRILDATLDVLDADGPERFSMRALSGHLGVTATAIYYYFDGKNALLDAAAAHAVDDLIADEDEDDDGPWDERLVTIASAATSAAHRRPRVFTWLMSNYKKQAPLDALDEALLSLLAQAGLDTSAAVHAKGAIIRLLIGHIIVATTPTRPNKGRGRSADDFDAEAMLATALRGIVRSFTPTH